MRGCLLILLCLCTAPILAAPASDAELERLLTVSRARFLSEQTLSGIEAVDRISAAARDSSPEQRCSQQILDRVRQEFSWEALHPELKDYYRNFYTEEDVRDLIDFYRSSQGRKYLRLMSRYAEGHAAVRERGRSAEAFERSKKELEAMKASLAMGQGGRIGDLLGMTVDVPTIVASRYAEIVAEIGVASDKEEVPMPRCNLGE
ncbi:MAG: DUF2059 domain-containing protein [Xanthomonadaceae bacterium]|nr:DUF2059 domain-containing protein [Xanthomonadaceae bacterium]